MEGEEEQKDQGQEVGYQDTTNDIAGTTTLTILIKDSSHTSSATMLTTLTTHDRICMPAY